MPQHEKKKVSFLICTSKVFLNVTSPLWIQMHFSTLGTAWETKVNFVRRVEGQRKDAECIRRSIISLTPFVFCLKLTGLIIPQREGQRMPSFQSKCVLRTSYIRTLQNADMATVQMFKCIQKRCEHSNAFKLIVGHSGQFFTRDLKSKYILVEEVWKIKDTVKWKWKTVTFWKIVTTWWEPFLR